MGDVLTREIVAGMRCGAQVSAGEDPDGPWQDAMALCDSHEYLRAQVEESTKERDDLERRLHLSNELLNAGMRNGREDREHADYTEQGLALERDTALQERDRVRSVLREVRDAAVAYGREMGAGPHHPDECDTERCPFCGFDIATRKAEQEVGR